VHPSLSCECNIERHRKDFRKANAVFIGRVLDIKTNENYDSQKDDLAFYKIRLKVVKSWKGADASEITILSNNGPFSTCGGFEFHKNDEYLIYAFGKNKVALSFCTRSGPIKREYAAEYMKELNSPWFRFKARVWPF
jgi:hypothetical protein